MRAAPVIPIPPRGPRRRLERAAQARRRLDAARRGRESEPRRHAAGGRAWINGDEVGGREGRFGHLEHTHD